MSQTRKIRITLNISGKIFETYEETLEKFPDTLLGEKKKRSVYYCVEKQEHFFDRNRMCFQAILYFYQSGGTLNCPLGVEIPLFEEECRFFLLPDDVINDMKRREGIIFDLNEEEVQDVTNQITVRKMVWDILDNPNTSLGAWTFGFFSFSMISISVVSECMHKLFDSELHVQFHYVNLILNIWFLTELVLRLLFSKDKLLFVQEIMNLVDTLAVIPYFVFMNVNLDNTGWIGVFNMLKFVRVMRLFRLSRHSRRLQVVGIILKSCVGNFQLLIICLIIVICVGGSFMYYAEGMIKDTEFTSIPQCLWWGVQTIACVGYGDLVPRTLLGKIFACGFMLFGAVTISLPVLTIVAEFATIYPKNVAWEEYMKCYMDGKRGDEKVVMN